MTPEQLKVLRTTIIPRVNTISLYDLEDKSERTLLLGRRCDRQTHHVYIKAGAIHTVVYDVANYPPVTVPIIDNHCYVPSYVDPARSDFEFCHTLILRGVRVIFTPHCPNVGCPPIDGLYFGMVLPA